MLLKRVELQAAQAQYESLIINTCGLILRNPQDVREHKGFVWKFRQKIQENKYSRSLGWDFQYYTTT